MISRDLPWSLWSHSWSLLMIALGFLWFPGFPVVYLVSRGFPWYLYISGSLPYFPVASRKICGFP